MPVFVSLRLAGESVRGSLERMNETVAKPQAAQSPGPRPHRCNDRVEDLLQALFTLEFSAKVRPAWRNFRSCMKAEPGQESREGYVVITDPGAHLEPKRGDMVKVNSKFLKEHHPDAKLKDLSQLALAAKDIDEVALPGLPQLTRLDLSRNQLSRLDGLAACASLKWLNLASNHVSSIGPLASLSNLQVLNLGSNQLKGTIGLASLTALGALILPDNQLTGITGLSKLPRLNTLVLKGNALQSLGHSLEGCSGLKKLSLGHNGLTSLGTALQSCCALHELRLSHNQLTSLPDELAACSSLRILDAGHNPIASPSAILVLKQLMGLRNLCLAGCPLAAGSKYSTSMLQLSGTISILDGKHLEGRSKPRRPKALVEPEPAAASAATSGPSVNPDASHGTASGVPGGNEGRPPKPAKRSKQMRNEVSRDTAVPASARLDAPASALPEGSQQLPGKQNAATSEEQRDLKQQQKGLQLKEVMPAIKSVSNSKKQRRLEHEPPAASKKQRQSGADSVTASAADPKSASESTGVQKPSSKSQHPKAGKRTGSRHNSKPAGEDDDEDRVVELQPRAMPKQQGQGSSGVLGIFEANNSRAKAGQHTSISILNRGGSKHLAHQAGSHTVTPPITGAAAAQLLLQQAQPPSADVDDLPGWSLEYDPCF
ncbi:hypothetical protein WJX74_006677 [Apatococcus lobatus]|uniref:Uncharacterized protein n=1 Tax=Apatococcus lobatus TaxID=904363 RepID=A0AAW1S7R3_9CHLO